MATKTQSNTKTQSILSDAINSLAEKTVFATLYGVNYMNMPVTASYLLADGRARQRVWRELQVSGYITEEVSGKPFVALATAKAFDELLLPAVFDLADLYTFDVWRDRKDGGKDSARVVLDDLKVEQKAFVIREMLADPASYTFLAFNRYSPEKVTVAAGLAGCAAAMEAAGGWSNGVLAVTNAAVKAKRKAGARAAYKVRVASQGLTPFLHGVKVIEAEDSMPVLAERSPILVGSVALSRCPEDWPVELPESILQSKRVIKEARERLAMFEKMAEYVETLGGWKQFMENYDATVERHVVETFDKV